MSDSMTVLERMRVERNKYRAFIVRLARTELHVVPDDMLDLLPRWYTCPRCASTSPLGVATHVTEARQFRHTDDCPVWEARQLLGLLANAQEDDMRLQFGSVEANKILEVDKILEAEAAGRKSLEGLPAKRWRVTVETTRDERYTIMARSAEEAMEICGHMHEGDPYDAYPTREQ